MLVVLFWRGVGFLVEERRSLGVWRCCGCSSGRGRGCVAFEGKMNLKNSFELVARGLLGQGQRLPRQGGPYSA